jgi:hypothetical protein
MFAPVLNIVQGFFPTPIRIGAIDYIMSKREKKFFFAQRFSANKTSHAVLNPTAATKFCCHPGADRGE